MNHNDLEITICKSPHDPVIGAHICNGLIIQNKLSALEQLKIQLVKECFSNIDENDLIDGEAFLKELDSE
jgi:hypothetical protein